MLNADISLVRKGFQKVPIQSLRGVLHLLGGSYTLEVDKAKPLERQGSKAVDSRTPR